MSVDAGGVISRRGFLAGGVGLAIVAAAPFAPGGRAMAVPRVALKRSTFTRLHGATFRMRGAGRDLEVVLSQINDLRPVYRANDEDRFALVFRARLHDPLPGAIYTFHHPSIGDVALFVSPVGHSTTATTYEAVINRR
jgi:hypothetical protein